MTTLHPTPVEQLQGEPHAAHPDSSEHRLALRKAASAVGLVAAVGLSAAGIGAAIEGVAPHPTVNPKSSTELVDANNGLRDAGPYALLVGGALFGAGALYRRRNEQLDAALMYTDRHKTARRVGLGLTTVIIGTTGAGMALGSAAAQGANVPVQIVARAAGSNAAAETVMVQSKGSLPLDHSIISRTAILKFSQDVAAEGGSMTPFDLDLGNVSVPSKVNNPPDSPIVALPAQSIVNEFGIGINPESDNCTQIEAITNQQLGAHQASEVSIQGEPAQVIKTIPVYPGLGRGLAIEDLEQATGCTVESNSYSGLAFSGISQRELTQIMMSDDLSYYLEPMKQYEGEYAEFWNKSVDPSEMQLVLYLFISSMLGNSALKVVDVMNRRRQIAAQDSDGFTSSQFGWAEFIRAGAESVKAGAAAGVLTYALVALNASSQYGISETYDAKALGSGFIAGLGANLIGAAASAGYIASMKKTNVEREG
jgi:hypothetical protein